MLKPGIEIFEELVKTLFCCIIVLTSNACHYQKRAGLSYCSNNNTL